MKKADLAQEYAGFAPFVSYGSALASAGSAVEFIDALIEAARSLRASDIHIDALAEHSLARLRIDGALRDFFEFDKALHPEVISRIKVLAGLRTDEHFSPQDGRFRVVLKSEAIDVRVSVVPAYWGEHAVLRLLLEQGEQFTLSSLGFGAQEERRVSEALARPHGMILATGPTGSGKTTTLYAMLKALGSRDVAVVTLEDPIEYAIPGMTQIQVEPRRGLTFGSGLRSILRQDPDIIMVGEIRDTETARLAVNAALTGHRLLSTLHTSSASGTLPRLVDMGIDPYLVASTVSLAIGQRLVRRLCGQCAEPHALTDAEKEYLRARFPEAPTEGFRRGAGCVACGGSGFSGRVCLSEVLPVDEAVRDAILSKAHAASIAALAIERGMRTLVADGIAKAAGGETTLGEVLRAVGETV